MRRPRIASLAVILALGCGGAAQYSRSGNDTAVALSLVTADGRRFDVAAFRGQPCMLFFFTTYDTVSQAAILPLKNLFRKHRELRAVGVALQPNPQSFLPVYARALDVPFVLAYEPEGTVLSGQSMLGRVDTVPAFVLLDRYGRVVDRIFGFADEPALERLIEKLH